MVAERGRLRAESTRRGATGDEAGALGLAREAARFDASFLPERIVCDTGVIALKVDDGERVVYDFYDNRLGSDVASAVVFLVDDIVQRTAPQAEERHAHAFRLFQRFLGGKMLQKAKENPLNVSAPPAAADSGGPP